MILITEIFLVWILHTLLAYSTPLEKAGNYQVQCDKGNFQACKALADMYYDGELIKKIIREYRLKAEKYYRKSCSGGILDSCYTLSEIYFRQGKKIESFNIIRDICNKGFKKGCTTLAYYYQQGYGVKQDFSKALNLYEKTCSQGEPDACLGAGYFYIENNITKAIYLFQTACSDHNGHACNQLGNFYSNGEYVDKNITRSLQYYHKACFEGLYSPACTKLTDIELGIK